MADILSNKGQGLEGCFSRQYEKKEEEKEAKSNTQWVQDSDKFLKKLEELEGMPIVSLFLSEGERTVRQVP
ncbi:MAG: hypothetical protein Q8927_08825 [Bacteroidota bacterium]|nr:hypothetical protein [Bacteroidota bacterium]MDP4244458.1 hypothetical protein [Bacteroidota bacterium]MDP4255210.1 hypothetical protein [Bacteroidota bacterium]MDP4258187.1 hypothetical protein [Bacteroidota bacterium]